MWNSRERAGRQRQTYTALLEESSRMTRGNMVGLSLPEAAWIMLPTSPSNCCVCESGWLWIMCFRIFIHVCYCVKAFVNPFSHYHKSDMIKHFNPDQSSHKSRRNTNMTPLASFLFMNNVSSGPAIKKKEKKSKISGTIEICLHAPISTCICVLSIREFSLHVCLQFMNPNRVDLFHSLLRVPREVDPPAGTKLSTDGRDRAQ